MRPGVAPAGAPGGPPSWVLPAQPPPPEPRILPFQSSGSRTTTRMFEPATGLATAVTSQNAGRCSSALAGCRVALSMVAFGAMLFDASCSQSVGAGGSDACAEAADKA